MAKFDDNFNIQIITRLFVNEIMRLMNGFCSDSDTRDQMLRAFKALNDKVQELKAPRDKVLWVLNQALDPTKAEPVAKLVWY